MAESDHGSELQERIFRFPPVAQRHVVSRHFPSPAVRGEIQNPHCLRWSRVFDRLSKCGAFKSRLPEPTLREAVREQGLRKNTDPLGFYRRRRPSRLTTRATRSDRSADMVRRRKRECRRWAVTRMSSIVLSTPRVRTLMLAVKHLDPIMGIDIHIVQPPGPVPPPIPSVHRNRARCCGLHPQDRRDCLHQRSSAGNRRHGRTGHSLAHPHGRRVREAADQRERAFPGQRDGRRRRQSSRLRHATGAHLPGHRHAGPAAPEEALDAQVADVAVGIPIPIPAGPPVMVEGPPSFLAALKSLAQTLAFGAAMKD